MKSKEKIKKLHKIHWSNVTWFLPYSSERMVNKLHRNMACLITRNCGNVVVGVQATKRRLTKTTTKTSPLNPCNPIFTVKYVALDFRLYFSFGWSKTMKMKKKEERKKVKFGINQVAIRYITAFLYNIKCLCVWLTAKCALWIG